MLEAGPSLLVDVASLLDRLYLDDDSGWTCPSCGYVNGGAYRLDCKYCNDGQHPWREIITSLWLKIGRTVDEDGELSVPDDWTVSPGIPARRPPHRDGISPKA